MKVIYFDGIKDSPEFIELLKKGNILIIKKFFNHNVIILWHLLGIAALQNVQFYLQMQFLGL